MIKVYSTPACPWCMKLKEFLKKNKIKFEDVDVSGNIKVAHEMVKKSGQMGVPVTDIDGEIIIGFDEERLKKTLKKK
jgi:glutaredoxin 3